MKRYLVGCSLFIVFLAAVSGSLLGTTGSAYAGVKQGEQPSFEVMGIDGERHESAKLRGKVVLVEFWASWCVPCRKSLPFYAQLAAEYPQDLVVIAVSVDQKKKDAAQFIKAHIPKLSEQASFIVGWQKDQTLVKDFGPTMFPTAYLIGRDGRVVEVFLGADEAGLKRSEAAIKKLLASKK